MSNNDTNGDWHPADIIAALRKRGTNLSALSRLSGLASTTLANALQRRWPKGEEIIAAALDCHPRDIWPSRYPAPGEPEGKKRHR